MPARKILILLLTALSVPAFAQHNAIHPCAESKQQHHPITAQRGSVADLREDNYDVKYVKLDLNLTNQNANISGNALTRATAIASMSEYVFELTADLTIDSLKINGQNQAFTRSGDVGTVTLPTTLNAGTLFEAQVYYHGTIISGNGFFDRGLRSILSGARNLRYTFTLGESYVVKDWWPCKQSLQDKIDSSDVWVSVDSSLKAGSNGLLQRVTSTTATQRRYEWKNKYPIDYYLISASVGPYTDYSYYMHFTNSTDSMLMQNYIYPNTLAIRKPILDSTALMINYFSDLFTRYPFWQEKYGHCQAPLSGGEEHQTMTTIGIWDNDVVPHELAHQWFGDHVTCGTWKDIWLNEGFASYAEYLFVQHFNGAAAATTKIGAVHYNAMHEQEPFVTTITPAGSVYVDDTTDEDRIFSSRLTYNKASSIIHTLRFEANDDTLFFNTLRAYQRQFANSTATTEQFKALVAQQYGRNMDTFFNQWIYGAGWPIFHAAWNQKNGIALVSLDQESNTGNTLFKFSTPLEIKFTGPQGDTTIRVVTNATDKTFAIAWSKPVTGIVIDPNDWLLDEPGIITHNTSLAIGNIAGNNAVIYPNPVHDFLTLSQTNATELQLTDVTGRLIFSQPLQGTTQQVDMRALTPSIYLYRMLKAGIITAQGKLVKD